VQDESNMLVVGSPNRVAQRFRRALLEYRVDRLLLLLLLLDLHLCLRLRMDVQRIFVL